MLEKKTHKGRLQDELLLYLHHVLRENPLAAGVGADRMSKGMAHSFGKPIGIAAQVKTGKKLMRIDVNTQHLEVARSAMKKAQYKLPCLPDKRSEELIKIFFGLLVVIAEAALILS